MKPQTNQAVGAPETLNRLNRHLGDIRRRRVRLPVQSGPSPLTIAVVGAVLVGAGLFIVKKVLT